MPSAARPTPRIALPVVVLALVMVAVGVYAGARSVGGGGDDGDGGTGGATGTSAKPADIVRSGSEITGHPTAPPRFHDVRTTYEIRYRVRRPGQPDAIETLTARRPFVTRKVTTDADGDVRTEEETSLGRIASRAGPTTTAQVIAGPPVAGDTRLDAIATDAIAAGVLEPREQRRVAGRTCRVVRTGNGSDVVGPATADDYTDTCITDDGLVLEQWRVAGHQPAEHRVATKVDTEDPATDPTQLPIEPTLQVTTGGGFFRRADPTTEPPGEFFVLDQPPPGFTFEGRFSVIAAQPALLDPEQRNNVVASTADVFVDGADFVVLDRGATRGTVKPFEPHADGRPSDLGAVLGQGEALSTTRGNEVRVAIPGGRFVRIYGTVSTAELRAVAAALRRTPGGAGLDLSGGG